MIAVYINYPNTHISIYENSNSASLRKHNRPNQRMFRIDPPAISARLAEIEALQFAATESLNDVWFDIDFGDIEFEKAVVAHLQRKLSKRYTPFARVRPELK
jgi:hypothetical protein